MSVLLSASLVPITIVTEDLDKAVILTEALRGQAQPCALQLQNPEHFRPKSAPWWPGIGLVARAGPGITHDQRSVAPVGESLPFQRRRKMKTWLCICTHLKASERTQIRSHPVSALTNSEPLDLSFHICQKKGVYGTPPRDNLCTRSWQHNSRLKKWQQHPPPRMADWANTNRMSSYKVFTIWNSNLM